MTIVYSYKRNIYLNLTNRCSNRCCFCVRNQKDALGDADSLWLREEPTVGQVIEELDGWDMEGYDEIVFCGYGEPTERMDAVLEIAGIIQQLLRQHVRDDVRIHGVIRDGGMAPNIVPESASAEVYIRALESCCRFMRL